MVEGVVERRIGLVESDEAVLGCFPVMRELRPKLVEGEFVGQIRAMEREGYRMASLERGGVVRTVAGFRVMSMLVSGRTMYVDDLITAEGARSEGNGEAMLGWLIGQARAMGCDHFSLDSGTWRKDAHAFYLRHRLRISSFHFELPLGAGAQR